MTDEGSVQFVLNCHSKDTDYARYCAEGPEE